MSTRPPDRRAAPDGLPLRERKKVRTRSSIRWHALRLFTERGYEATTVERIAAAADVSPSTVFRYFPTKEDLVIVDEFDHVMIRALRGQPPELPLNDAVRATFRDVLARSVEENREDAAMRIRLLAAVPSLRARVLDSARGGAFREFGDAVAERVGRDADDPEVRAYTWAMLGVLMSAVFDVLDGDPGGATDDGVLDTLPAMIDARLTFLGTGMPLDP